MNRQDLVFAGVILSVLVIGVLLAPINAVPSIGDIPPTRAFQKIFVNSGDNVTANKYNANLNITSGANMLIEAFFANNTLRFSATAPTIYMEQIANVTSIGCALGQALTVNASAIWACSNVGTGDVTGAANVGTGTGLIFRDEAAGTLNIKTLKEGPGITITNNADDITLSSSAVGGFTSANNMAGGTAKILATNSSSKLNFKSLTQGTGVTITNSSTTITISASGSSTELNSMNGGTARLLKSNATGEGVFKSLTCTGVTSCTNGTDTITIRSEINSMNGGTAKILKANSTNGEAVFKSLTQGSNITITNGTDTITIAASVSGGATILAANVTGTLPGTDYLVWTIPLTANSGNTISGVITATSTVSGTAVQVGANVTNLNTRGFCHWVSVATTTTDAIDNIVMNTVATGRVTKNAETLWIAGANVAQPINFQCAVTTGPTAGNLRVFISPEIAGATISAKAGSFYIKAP